MVLKDVLSVGTANVAHWAEGFSKALTGSNVVWFNRKNSPLPERVCESTTNWQPTRTVGR